MKPKKRTTPDAHGIFGISRILGVLGALLLLAAACQSERLTDEGGFAPGQERPLIISTTLSGVASTRVATAATRAAAQGTTTPVSLGAGGKLVLTLHRSTDPAAPTQTAVYSLAPTPATPADEANPTYNLTYNDQATRDTLRARGIDPEQAQKLYVTAAGSYPLAAQGTAIKATVKQTATILPYPSFGLDPSTPLPATATLPFALHTATNGTVSIAPNGTTNLPLSITSAGLMLRMKRKGITKPGEARISINSVRCLLTKETALYTPSTPADDEQAGTASRVVDATFADNGNLPAHDTDGIGTSYVLFGTLPAGKMLTAGTPIAEIDAKLVTTTDSGGLTSEKKTFTLILPSKVTLTAGQLLTYTVHVNHSLASIEGDVTISDFTPANGDGGQQAGVGNVADGTQPLDPNFFNAQNTTWIVTGGGTPQADTLVAKNVRQALNRIYNPRKEDGSWNDDYTGSAFIDLILLEVSTLPTRGELETGAFQKYQQLRSVSLPAAKTIGSGAFDSCTKLATVSLPAAETIGDFAFYICTALTTISLPEATSIGKGAFQDCDALTTLSLPVAKSIGKNAFFNCNKLTTLRLTAAGDIELQTDAFSGFTTDACTLVLNPKKKPADGSTPNQWGGVTWKSITYAEK